MSAAVAGWPPATGDVAAFFAAVSLSLLGVLFVLRNRLFAGAALPQVSALGATLAAAFPCVFDGNDWLPPRDCELALAVGPAIVVALTLHYVARTHERFDALCAWLILAAASTALLLLDANQAAMDELRRIMTSAALAADTSDAAMLVATAAAATTWVATSRRKLLLLTVDARMAAAVGIRVRLWTAMLAVLTGAAVGTSSVVAGVLFTFAFLVLPAIAAKSLCREMGSWFAVAAGLASCSAIAGLVAATRCDLAPAQAAVAVQVALVIPAALTSKLRRA